MGNVIAETAGGGATGATGTTREYIYLYETEIAPTMGSRTVVDRPLSVVDAVNTASTLLYNVSVDHLNRPVLMTNAAKSPVWTAIWQPWGGVHSITGSATLNSRFPGQWFQAETGLHYNWHRSYDPTLGRYTQPDPLGFVDGPSVYGYARGRPIQLFDFLGLTPGEAESAARGQLGSGSWCRDACQHSKARGRMQWWYRGKGYPKCNMFVHDMLEKGDVAPTEVPGARDWGDKSKDIPDYRVLPPNEPVQPGDVISDGSHVGIVSGPGQTISATSSTVLMNDFGFRQNQNVVIRRWVPPLP